jgi:hypothetical protein
MNDPPLIRLTVDEVPGGYSVSTPDSGATLVDCTRNPIQAACAALTILGYGPRVLVEFTLPIEALQQRMRDL